MRLCITKQNSCVLFWIMMDYKRQNRTISDFRILRYTWPKRQYVGSYIFVIFCNFFLHFLHILHFFNFCICFIFCIFAFKELWELWKNFERALKELWKNFERPLKELWRAMINSVTNWVSQWVTGQALERLAHLKI